MKKLLPILLISCSIMIISCTKTALFRTDYYTFTQPAASTFKVLPEESLPESVNGENLQLSPENIFSTDAEDCMIILTTTTSTAEASSFDTFSDYFDAMAKQIEQVSTVSTDSYTNRNCRIFQMIYQIESNIVIKVGYFPQPEQYDSTHGLIVDIITTPDSYKVYKEQISAFLDSIFYNPKK